MAQAAAAGLREEWRTGHLSLAGLRGSDRLIARLAVGVILVACGLIVALGLGFILPGGATVVPGRLLAERAPVEVPTLSMALACIGLAAAGATVAVAASHPGRPSDRLPLIIFSLMFAGLGGLGLGTVGAVAVVVGIVPSTPFLVPAYTATSVLALVCAVVVPLASLTRLRHRRWLAPLVGSAPFLALLVTIVLSSGDVGTLTPWVNAQFIDYPAVLPVAAIIFGPILFLIGSTTGLLILWTFWGTTTWSRASARQVGTHLAHQAGRLWWLLAALLGAKLAWLALGATGRLPVLLGGSADGWADMRSDDAFSWLYAGLLALAAGIWLLRSRRPVDERRGGRYAGYVVVAFAGLSLLLAAQPLLAPALATIWPAPFPPVPDDAGLADCVGRWLPLGGTALSWCLASVASAWQAVWWFAVIVAATAAGLLRLYRRRGDTGAWFLVVLGVWALPRAIDAVRQSAPPGAELLTNLPPLDAPQPETMDAALTILVAALALQWWARRQRAVGPGPLMIVLVVSTLLVHGNTILPTAPLSWLLALVIAFPVLYELAFDSEDLNQPGPRRAGRLLAAMSLRALALTLLAATVALDIGGLASGTDRRLAFLIFAPPFAAIVVGATIRSMAAEGQPSRRDLAGPLLAGALGAGAVAVIGAASLTLEPALRPLYATRADRLAALEERAALANAYFVRLVADQSSEGAAAATTGLMVLWQEETAWLAANPSHPCATEVSSAWKDVVDDFREVSILLGATAVIPSAAPQAEIDAVGAKLATLGPTFVKHQAAYAARLEAARSACAPA